MKDTKNQLQLLIISHQKRLPKFIDIKKSEHKQAFDTILDCLDSFEFLCTSRFFSIHNIEILLMEIEFELRTIIDGNLLINVIAYLDFRLKQYFETAINLELYEAAENIKKYNSFNV